MDWQIYQHIRWIVLRTVPHSEKCTKWILLVQRYVDTKKILSFKWDVLDSGSIEAPKMFPKCISKRCLRMDNSFTKGLLFLLSHLLHQMYLVYGPGPLLTTKCTVFTVLDHFWPPNVPCLRYWATSDHQMYRVYGPGPLLTTKCTMFGHWWTPICNLLCYWWHCSICHTGLFTTPLIVVTFFLVTMSSDPLISCLGAVLGSLLSWMLAADWLADCY
jgi:hypothetical protein